MSRGRKHDRAGAAVYRSKRWKALRLEILRRDNWQCKVCGSNHDLEVDHIQSIEVAPEKAFESDNLQVLCKKHHSSKTRLEKFGLMSPEREAWRELILSM